jgi:hypothetical protein
MLTFFSFQWLRKRETNFCNPGVGKPVGKVDTIRRHFLQFSPCGQYQDEKKPGGSGRAL